MKRLIHAGVAAAVLVALAGCSTPGGGDGGDDTILFGGISATTGAFGQVGTATFQGAQFAIDEINEDGGILGKQVRFESADDRADSTLSTQLFNKYVSAGAAAIIGSPATGPTTATLADQLHVVSIGVVDDGGLTIYPDGPDKPPHPYAFNTISNAFAWGEKIAEHALTHCSGLALLHDTTSEGMGGLASIQSAYEKAGESLAYEEPISENWGTGATVTLKSEIEKIAESGADCVVVWLTPQDMASFVQESASLGQHFTFYGHGTVNADNTFSDLAGAQGDGFLGADITARLNPSERLTAFQAAYKARFGMDPGPFAEGTYDAVYMLKQAIEAAGSADPEAIKDQLDTMSDFDGITGTITFTPQIHTAINGQQLEMVRFNGQTLTWDPLDE